MRIATEADDLTPLVRIAAVKCSAIKNLAV